MASRELLLSRLANQMIQNVSRRHLSKSSQRPKVKGQHNRLWAMPGDFVGRKEIVAKQFTMKWHPGLNTGIDDNRNIYALCDGVLVVTEDKFDPDWSHPLVDHIYNDDDIKMAPLYKRYIHIIPKRRISEFKLVDLV